MYSSESDDEDEDDEDENYNEEDEDGDTAMPDEIETSAPASSQETEL